MVAWVYNNLNLNELTLGCSGQRAGSGDIRSLCRIVVAGLLLPGGLALAVSVGVLHY